MTHAQWELTATQVPQAPVKTDVRPRIHPRQRIFAAILHLGHSCETVCMASHSFPRRNTMYLHIHCRHAGEAIHNAMRAITGQVPSAFSGNSDAQTLRNTDIVGAECRGRDAGNEIMRHLLTGIPGKFATRPTIAASLRERDDNHAGRHVEAARSRPGFPLQIVAAPAGGQPLEALSKRRPIEHTRMGFSTGADPNAIAHAYPQYAEAATTRATASWPSVALSCLATHPASGRLRPGAMPRGIHHRERHEPP